VRRGTIVEGGFAGGSRGQPRVSGVVGISEQLERVQMGRVTAMQGTVKLLPCSQSYAVDAAVLRGEHQVEAERRK
jgi:hypothetical protein